MLVRAQLIFGFWVVGTSTEPKFQTPFYWSSATTFGPSSISASGMLECPSLRHLKPDFVSFGLAFFNFLPGRHCLLHPSLS
jgi:hypothetical protein